MFTGRNGQLYVLGIKEKRVEPELVHLRFSTTRGDFRGYFHTAPGLRKGVVFLGDAGNGCDGPGLLYPELARNLLKQGIASIRLTPRMPDDCAQSGLDTLVALQYLDDEGIRDVALVGWSMGGAVALSVGAFAKTVRAIAAISTLAVSCNCVRRIHSKPLLLLHGDADSVCSLKISRRIHDEAVGPHRLIVYANAGHTLEEVKGQPLRDLSRWLVDTLNAAQHDAANH